ncbi:DUF192 domain-containing protein [Rhizobiaceae bacterium n13]|uniref:DUF192 domain-containing protein n=1 Tax=Ferirhizobium litorale TaxID=2927786 RepID=A0AAE3QJL4_9HYPH|nr:DUF192 domain-containing protein [Fererhizobium litorale]MDI7863970.1 DUF192 domain-containing protein [Fererhizobium litorale]MDI7924546.1 DUF192 domain-containing protein [Fererhizobium litorale]
MLAAGLQTIAKSAFMALFLLLPLAATADEPVRFGEESLTIETASGRQHVFQVEVAATPEQRARGLMFRNAMDKDRGMLFDFGETRRVTMWMKDTPLPLDMLFIEADGGIHRIVERTVPYSEAIIDSHGPVKYVLELNGGQAAELGIAAGDRVFSKRIGAEGD